MPTTSLAEDTGLKIAAQEALYAHWCMKHPTIGSRLRYIRDLLQGTREPEMSGDLVISVEGCFAHLGLEQGSFACALAGREISLYRWPGQVKLERRLRVVRAIALLVKTGDGGASALDELE